MKKKISAVVLAAILLMSMSIQVFAAEEYELKSGDAVFSITESEAPATKAQYDYTVTESIAYPAILSQLSYYDVGTWAAGSGQWCNITLSPAASNVYRQTNCDAFYVLANINAGPAKTYKLYLNDELVGQGSVPSQYMSLKVFIENNNPGKWKLVLYDIGDTVGIPVWGYIHLS